MTQPFHSIRYPIGLDEGLGRLAEEKRFGAHVEQLMRQVLLTSPGERVNRPDFGCGVKQMLFAPNSEVTENLARLTVFQALEQWLGSVIDVEQVEISSSQEILTIRIRYLLLALQTRKYLNLEVALS